jgi:hypothetical protein
MLERKVRQEILLLVALLFCTFGANVALAKDKGHKHHTKTVNCNKHNASVQSAIGNRQGQGRPGYHHIHRGFL